MDKPYGGNGTVYRYNGTSWVVDSDLPRQQTLIQDILITEKW